MKAQARAKGLPRVFLARAFLVKAATLFCIVALLVLATGCGEEIPGEVVVVPESTVPDDMSGKANLQEKTPADERVERNEQGAGRPEDSSYPEVIIFEEIPLYEEVELKGRVFNLELAPDGESRQRGLIGRESLEDDQGMLFVFPDAEPYPRELNFWMKGCLIPLDVIFIDRNGVITAVHQMDLPPPGLPDHELNSYSSDGPAQFAIEVRGGVAKELGLQVGDRVDLRTEYLLNLARW